jgi:hypothetical protein
VGKKCIDFSIFLFNFCAGKFRKKYRAQRKYILFKFEKIQEINLSWGEGKGVFKDWEQENHFKA